MRIALSVLAAILITGAGTAWWLRRQEAIKPTAAPAAGAKLAADRLRFAAGAPQLNYVQTAQAEEAAMPATEALPARIAVDEDVTARVSTPLAGRVVQIHVQPGDKVARGAALVSIDAPDFGAAVADLRKAEADGQRKFEAYQRAKQLYEGEAIARRDLETAAADLRAAEAEKQRAQLRVQNLNRGNARIEGERLVLRAPVDGVVVDRKVNPGMEARPDLPDPLVIISDTSRLWLLIDLPERDLAQVHVGQPVSLDVQAYPQERFMATVTRIGQVVDPATRRVQVRCSLPNADGRLKPEMFATASLSTEARKDAVRVPSSAVITEGLYSYVFVQTAPGEFHKRRVQIARQDAGAAFLPVGGGVDKGELVVIKGALLLNSELSAGEQ
jgi:cobalt-zinc-cadmium efflux system membrane fusion protein